MKYYFLSFEVLKRVIFKDDPVSDRFLEDLLVKKYSSVSSFSIGSIKGILFSSDALKTFMVEYHLELVRSEASGYDGILVPVFEGGKVSQKKMSTAIANTEGEIIVTNWEGKQHNMFVEIVKKFLAPFLSVGVKLSVPHGYRDEITSGPYFFIKLWSSHVSSEHTRETPSSIFEIPVQMKDSSFAPSGEGVPIVDPETAHTVAELVGNNLYIFHDICHYGSHEELALFTRIICEVLVILGVPKSTVEELVRSRESEKHEKSKQNWVDVCKTDVQNRIHKTKREIEEAESQISDAQQRLVDNIRKRDNKRKDEEQLLAQIPSLEKRFAAEYEKLLTVYKVRGVEIKDKKISVFTDELVVTDPRTNKQHLIGKMRIELFTDGGNDCVRWINLDRRGPKNHHAPHINPEGKACLGNTAEIWPELIAKYEFATCAMMAIQFIESVNVQDDWGKYIDSYPEYHAKQTGTATASDLKLGDYPALSKRSRKKDFSFVKKIKTEKHETITS